MAELGIYDNYGLGIHKLINLIFKFPESRSWFKIKLLGKEKGSPDKEDNADTEKLTPSSSGTFKKSYSGNFNPEDNLIFKALNMIENETFYSESKSEDSDTIDGIQHNHGIVKKALVYLNYL